MSLEFIHALLLNKGPGVPQPFNPLISDRNSYLQPQSVFYKLRQQHRGRAMGSGVGQWGLGSQWGRVAMGSGRNGVASLLLALIHSAE